jgi:hypothetical protein
LLGRAARPEAVAVLAERRVPQRLKPLEHRLLNHTVDHGWNAEVACPAGRLRDLHPTHRLRLVATLEQLIFDFRPARFEEAWKLPDGDAVDTGRSLVLRTTARNAASMLSGSQIASIKYAVDAGLSGSDVAAITSTSRTAGRGASPRVQSFGWYNISHLGAFIWWLQSFPIRGASPVSNAPIVAGQPSPCFTFDPSGRQVPLFEPSSRIGTDSSNSFGDDWVSPNEWELPVAVREVLWNAYPDQLYGPAFSVELGVAGAPPAPVPREQVLIHPETGQFSFTASPPEGEIEGVAPEVDVWVTAVNGGVLMPLALASQITSAVDCTCARRAQANPPRPRR